MTPEVILFDGNGILHPRGLGLASHFGVVTNICTVGVAKNLYQMDNIKRDGEHVSKIQTLEKPGDYFTIKNELDQEIGVVSSNFD